MLSLSVTLRGQSSTGLGSSSGPESSRSTDKGNSSLASHVM